MATKTKEKKSKMKDKIKEALKSKVKDELVEVKEQQQKEIREKNSKLKEFDIYTKVGCPYCKQLKDALDQEGVKYNEKLNTEYPLEWQKVSGTTGLAVFPTIEIEDNYLVPRRDFQQIPQGVNMTIGLANPDVVKPSNEVRMIEGLKTLNYHMSMAFQQMNTQLTPITTFITNIEKQINEEEKEEKKSE